LYAYRCTQCGHRFEKIQNFSAEPELECPLCQGLLERPLTAPRLHFKGAGWYVNDYAGKSAAPASESAPAETKAPAAKTEAASTAPASTPAPTTAPSSTP
jgi:putative FmdB family regulatory protein